MEVNKFSRSPAYNDISRGSAILHAFNWSYREIQNKANEIKNAGYDRILISPPHYSTGDKWHDLYQPIDLRVIDNNLGNKEDLQALLETMKKIGIKVYADVVLNHMANPQKINNKISGGEILNYPGGDVLTKYNENSDYYLKQRLFGDLNKPYLGNEDFHKKMFITDFSDITQVQDGRIGSPEDGGLPDLSDTDRVVSLQREYLSALKKMGISGFRIDAAKHMSTNQINKIFDKTIVDGMHIFGEIITGGGPGDAEYNNFLDPYLKECQSHGAYDFPLFKTLKSVFGHGGDFSDLINIENSGYSLPKSRAITFSVTHDIPNNDCFKNDILSKQDEYLIDAFLLSRDGGSPLIFSGQSERDPGRWKSNWESKDYKYLLEFHNMMHGQPMRFINAETKGCKMLFTRGDLGFVCLNKSADMVKFNISTENSEAKKDAIYIELLTGKSVTLGATNTELEVEGRSIQLWYRSQSKTNSQ